MKNIAIRTKLSLMFICLVFIFSSISTSNSLAKTYSFKWSNHKQIEVTAYKLNVRTGPGTSYARIDTISQGDIIDVIGSIGSWYVVHLDNDVVGLISSTYTRVYSYHNPPNTNNESKSDPYSGNITYEEQQFINLVNQERKKVGLSELKIDMEVMRVARIKAEDLSINNYFDHTSPVYGSPFQMLKDFAIFYQYAGENIAGNSTVTKAHTSLMNSQGHKDNILSKNYDAIGVGIVNDAQYGKVFVQMFIKR